MQMIRFSLFPLPQGSNFLSAPLRVTGPDWTAFFVGTLWLLVWPWVPFVIWEWLPFDISRMYCISVFFFFFFAGRNARTSNLTRIYVRLSYFPDLCAHLDHCFIGSGSRLRTTFTSSLSSAWHRREKRTRRTGKFFSGMRKNRWSS